MDTNVPGLNVVLVEDHDIVRQLLQQVLEEAGHQVVGLSCAEELEDEADGLPIDIFLIDLNLPGEDGLSLTERLRAAYPLAGLIVVTARSSLDDKIESYARGADLYLSKPVEAPELCAAIASLGRRRQSVGALMAQHPCFALSKQAIQSEHLNFVYMVTHEVRTPLSVIFACIDNILASSPKSESLDDRLHKIQRHAQKIETVFKNHLQSARTLSQDKTIHIARVNLDGILHRVVNDFQENHANVVALHIEQGLYVHVDTDLISIALHNLLENASKYSHEGSLIDIQLRRSGMHAELRIKDSGIGVQEYDLPHIFENHYRGQNSLSRPGMGLGLPLAQSIAQQNAGHISAERNPDQGMTFTWIMPIDGTHCSR